MPVVSEGYPKLVSEEWPGVEGEVDAAFTNYEMGRTYFFVKGEPWVYLFVYHKCDIQA